MAIVPNHPHIDSKGMVYLPYLSSWNPHSSSPLELIEILQNTFSHQPPVYSTAATEARTSATNIQNTNYNSYTSKQSITSNTPTYYNQPSSVQTQSSGSMYNYQTTPTYNQYPQTPSYPQYSASTVQQQPSGYPMQRAAQTPPVSSMEASAIKPQSKGLSSVVNAISSVGENIINRFKKEDPEGNYKRNQLRELILKRWNVVMQPMFAELDEQLALQNQLNEREKNMKSYHDKLKTAQNTVNDEIQNINNAYTNAEETLQLLQAKQIDIDEFIPTSGLSKQIIELTAKQSALTDVLDRIDDAARLVPFEELVNPIREVSKELFYTTVLLEKAVVAKRTQIAG